MRQWIEAGLADLDDSATVSLADVRRALASLATPPPPERTPAQPPVVFALAAAFICCLYSRTRRSESASVMSATDRYAPSSP